MGFAFRLDAFGVIQHTKNVVRVCESFSKCSIYCYIISGVIGKYTIWRGKGGG